MPHSEDSRCSYSLNVSFFTSKARRLLDAFITDYLQASLYPSPLKNVMKRAVNVSSGCKKLVYFEMEARKGMDIISLIYQEIP